MPKGPICLLLLLQLDGNLKRYFELNSKKNKYWKILLIVFCFLVSIVAWLGFSERGLIHLYHTEMERQSYIVRIRQLAEENQTLLEEVHRLRTDMKYIESIVKEQFNLIKPNEVVYRFNKAKTRNNGIATITQNAKQIDQKTRSKKEIGSDGDTQ